MASSARLLLLLALLGASGPVARAAGGDSTTSPASRRAVITVLDLRGLRPGALLKIIDARGTSVGSARAGATAAHLSFAGLPAGRYSVVLADDADAAFFVEFNGQRITGTADTLPPPVQAGLPGKTGGH